MRLLRLYFTALQLLASETHRLLNRPSRLLMKWEDFGGAWSGALLAHALIKPGIDHPFGMAHHAISFGICALVWINFLLDRYSDPAPELVGIDLDSWLHELTKASSRDADSVLFGVEIRKANLASIKTVAKLLHEGFGSRTIRKRDRNAICQMIVRRSPYSILLLYHGGELAGCLVVMSVDKLTASQFLSGRINESHFSPEAVLSRAQVRRSRAYILVSAVYLRHGFRTEAVRQALFLALFALTARMLISAREFLIFCEPVSKNGLRTAKSLGFDEYTSRGAAGYPLYTLRDQSASVGGPVASTTVGAIFALRDHLITHKTMPTFLR